MRSHRRQRRTLTDVALRFLSSRPDRPRRGRQSLAANVPRTPPCGGALLLDLAQRPAGHDGDRLTVRARRRLRVARCMRYERRWISPTRGRHARSPRQTDIDRRLTFHGAGLRLHIACSIGRPISAAPSCIPRSKRSQIENADGIAVVGAGASAARAAAHTFRKPSPTGTGGLLGEIKEEGAAAWRRPGDIRARRPPVPAGPTRSPRYEACQIAALQSEG